jgi:carbonic anhydrase/acetyltransferase-like protein (isoleucine patch superfamily)
MKFVHDKAIIIGNVEVGEDTSIWPGAVLRADLSSIRIGKDCSIQDNSVIHTSSTKPVEIGDKVIIGHGVVLDSCQIGTNILIGINSVVLDGCRIGDNVLIAAGTLLKPNTEIPSNSFVYQKNGELIIKEIQQRHLKMMEDIRREYSNLAGKYLSGEFK